MPFFAYPEQVASTLQLAFVAIPIEPTCHGFWQGDGGDEIIAFDFVVHSDVAVRRRHCPTNFLDISKVRSNSHFGEARSVAVNAQNGAEELDVRACSPGMAVAACGVDVGTLAAGRQSELEKISPDAEPG